MSFVAAVGLRLVGVRILQVSSQLLCWALLISSAYGQEKRFENLRRNFCQVADLKC